jgi:amino acid adenylation domain-containing protein
VDLQDKSKEKQEEHIHSFFETERKKRFDITSAPLWKAHLFRLSPDRMVYTFQFHHAILDGWSLASLNTELFDVYEKLASHQTITPAPLKSTNKLSVIDALMIKEDVSYTRFWQDYLNGSERNDLFSEKMMPDQVQENFEAVDMEQLEKLAENLKTTPRTIFLGCYLYALSLMTFEKDITIGVVTNNRPLHEDGDKLLGCFLNTVPLRINMESSWTWKDFILALHKNINETKGKDRLPLTHIHKSIHQDHPSVHPLFDCIFNYVNFHIYDSLHQTGSAGNKFKDLYNDLSLENQFQLQSFENVNSTFIFTLRSSNGKISGTFRSKKEFKSGIPLNEFVTYFNTALQLMVTKPNRLIQNRDVLPPAVTARLLNEFNSTQADDPLPTTFLEKLDTTVMRFPDRIAVSFEDRHISYSELNRAANQFAHFLIKKYKINNQDKIGVKIERNEQLPVVLLAILKTGSAYVPLDINYPKSRIEYIERNSDCRLVITDKEWNAFKNEQQQYSNQTPEVEQKSSDLAYIIYTSGTTGHPKGVMIHHSNVLQLINWAEQTFDQTKFDVVFAGTSHCFDLSVFEMFYSLSVGKRVRILSNALQIKDYLQEEKILINTVPSSLRTLLEQSADLKNVRFVNLAGEIFPVDVADKLRKWDMEVRNLYGPSEDTTYSTSYKLSDKDYKTIPIGQPLPNTQAFILNENADLLPPGVDGYLYLSGEGLSSGYANNPELTAEKFIYNPRFDQLRMYNTGDIARWTADGIIEYVGRKDNQVKLKGFRIELEEIENAISRFSGSIGQVVTTVKEDQLGKALVAYYVSKESTDKTELRHFLSTQLPVYMIPHYFIEMPAIPLTPNGKTDLKALPDLLQGDLIKRTYQPPVSALQQQLVRIWEDVLKFGQVGISDNFFELGGDSLLALRAISIIQKQMEITIPPDIYFRLSTIQELSDYLESATVANSTEDIQEYDVYDL